jgi:flagellar basal-body rod protein FlgC
MGVDGISSGAVDIAISGLRAQRLRMDTIANNIANVHTRRTDTGRPYRRRDVVLASRGGDEVLAGVQILRIAEDVASPFRKVRDPGDPSADKDGFVLTSNVNLPREMVELVTASRAYQANAAVLKRHQDSINTTLELLR